MITQAKPPVDEAADSLLIGPREFALSRGCVPFRREKSEGRLSASERKGPFIEANQAAGTGELS